MIDRVKKIRELARIPMKGDREIKRVEIVVLKFRESPEVINECVSRIIHNTSWPFKLNIYDNRPNTANTSRIWNKLITEATCDYVCLIDSDAFVPKGDPCWLTRMMESIDETGMVVPVGDNVGGSNKATNQAPYPSHTRQTGIWSGFCFLMKKDVLERAGKFDEDFYLYGQDSEYAHRVRKKIGGAIYRTDVLVRHIGSYSADKAQEEGTLDREADKVYAGSLFRLKTK